MRLARESAASTMAFGDDAALDRVVRLESHLMRQLEATLTLLARLRGDGASRAALGGLGALVREVAARVTGITAGEPSALPEAVGSFRNGDLREVGGGGNTMADLQRTVNSRIPSPTHADPS